MVAISVDVFDPNWELRISYPIILQEGATREEYARRALEGAIRDGIVQTDEAKFCRMRVRPDALGSTEEPAQLVE